MSYIRLDPAVSQIRLSLFDAYGGELKQGLSHDIDFTLTRKGCDSTCVTMPVSVDGCDVVVQVQGLDTLQRGYYTGQLRIGCEETCPLDFWLGVDICVKPTLTRADCAPGVLGACQPICTPCGKDGTLLQSDYKVVADNGVNVTLRYFTTCAEIPDPCEFI
ncbi:MAG: hypothetical protein BWK73_20155 [Thiothrix lacustris]|uniref:Uncharacterized protein n=1 Tax=Thiothrix lacustris TaxID=525917 RepID=A0A1Y1QPJ4_9GAMM|nr:MAG: hypothetical protein BWK73_20155 [Thiothrix lacustris]